MKVVVSDEASKDLDRIADHIAQRNPVRAVSFLRELRSDLARIGENPLAFPLEPRHARAGVQRKVYRDYPIFYRVKSETVTILHVLHGARDYGALLTQPDEP